MGQLLSDLQEESEKLHIRNENEKIRMEIDGRGNERELKEEDNVDAIYRRKQFFHRKCGCE